MATITEVRCDICGKLLLPTNDGRMPDSFKTHFESVKLCYLWDGKVKNFDLCPRCFIRMKRYLKRHGNLLDVEANDENA